MSSVTSLDDSDSCLFQIQTKHLKFAVTSASSAVL